MEKRVPHDYMYHAEIMYEGEVAMRYTCAVGNTMEELLNDIDKEFKEVQHRMPEIVEALVFPNGINKNITNLVNRLYYQREEK
ncbi:hypothetical protein [Marinobacter sp.]|jgi:hypothetical protein|uniref:hypothetical protein n=1 Tax=Marinobacter sp. TaxID=50741 RepID=UPI000C898621|nr:hypothetical protein [Marinobacter sp.]MAK51020.1 hypothetical protein [Marinobacter sp.]MAK51308.1 hypothetical protein [Marinobacter sp.]|tara:strand:- start:420 stop:668 length:249 start_codon:yes stop_codon:yes gene_type:complete